MVVDATTFDWGDTHWKGISLADAIVYELHIGTFTKAGTLRAAIDSSIEELLRRRPVQEETANRRERVLSVGRRCGKRGLGPAHFDSIATDDEFVNGELSAQGRKARPERPDLMRQFLRGALLLRLAARSLRPISAV